MERQIKGQDSLKDDAIQWIARLRAHDVSEREKHLFALWLARSPAHRAAFDEVADLWDDLGLLRHLPTGATELSSLAAAAPTRRRRFTRIATALAAAATIAALTLGQWLMPVDSGPVTYRTAAAEQRHITLEDGSRLALNAETEIEVHFADDQRVIQLVRGEAIFDVAHDPARPFCVDAGGLTATALGTSFNVYRKRESATVTVIEGSVRVDNALTREFLDPGMQARAEIGPEIAALAVSEADVEVATAWRSGRLIYRGAPLGEVIEDLNRYTMRTIRIVDPELEALTVTASLVIRDENSILKALETSFPLTVTRTSTSVHLHAYTPTRLQIETADSP